MRKLLLVRHAQTRPVAGVRPAEFALTEAGRRSCLPFARKLAPWNPVVIVTSEEPKARETGQIIGETLAVPIESHPGLEEHHRQAVERLGTQIEFQKAVERIFDELERVIYGEESGADALIRFSNAIDRALAAHPNGNVAVVTHGTVMALFAAAHNAIDAKTFWRGMEMPDLVILQLPDNKLVHPL
ncbi:MAG TPA: histidine phosphatase family protein [Anaerolineales bacterium]|nr:histidine phosphatase family protein [Anaerolineales bacterium]